MICPENVLRISNTYEPLKNKIFNVVPIDKSRTCRIQIVEQVFQELRKSKKIIMFCQTASLLSDVIKLTSQEFPNSKIKVYVGENKDCEFATCGNDKKQELMNVEDVWSDFDMVCFTGTISIGVDFNKEHFDTIIGVFTNDVGLSPDLFV